MTCFSRMLLVGTALVAGAGTAQAQYSWGRPSHPSSGACFYEDINYGGRFFCAETGETRGRVPSGTNDEISSIRLFGNAEVIVFRSNNMSGDSRRFTSSIRDLRNAGFNDRISSFVVERRNFNNGWGGAYGGGNWGGGGYSGGYGGNYGGAYGGGGQWNAPKMSYRQAEAVVRRAYRAVLKREPDPGASGYIDNVMHKGWNQQKVESELMKSAEYRNRKR